MADAEEVPEQTLFWNRVLGAADAIEQQGRPPVSQSAQSTDDAAFMSEQLSGLIEGFGQCFDPAEAFPEYATVLLCRSLERLLARQATSKHSNVLQKEIGDPAASDDHPSLKA
jgi:hypothetical protein